MWLNTLTNPKGRRSLTEYLLQQMFNVIKWTNDWYFTHDKQIFSELKNNFIVKFDNSIQRIESENTNEFHL